MVRKLIIFVFLTLFCACDFAFAQVGNRCVIKNTGQTGTCKLSADCPEVEEQAKNGISPTLCGFYQLSTPIVCCEKEKTNFQPNENSFLEYSPDSEEDDSSNNNNNQGDKFGGGQSNVNNNYNNNNYNNNGNDQAPIIYPENESTSRPALALHRKSIEKCEEYTKPVTLVVQAIPLVTDIQVTNLQIEKCDYNGIALIVGGRPAAAGEFPFMAVLGFSNGDRIEWKCGATLISEHFVVTAAHCTFSRESGQPKVVRLGDLDLERSDDGSEPKDYIIDEIIIHPNYKYPLKYNDIALIRMQEKVRFTKFIRPACLYVKSQLDHSKALATGYGKTGYAAIENNNKLMKVSLNIFDNSQCTKTFQPDKNLPQGLVPSMLCAGELKGGKDTCQGDSGGPLLFTKRDNHCKFYIIGVTSFGKSCGEVNTPAVYTRISEYLDWIENIIW